MSSPNDHKENALVLLGGEKLKLFPQFIPTHCKKKKEERKKELVVNICRVIHQRALVLTE